MTINVLRRSVISQTQMRFKIIIKQKTVRITVITYLIESSFIHKKQIGNFKIPIVNPNLIYSQKGLNV